jgi:hypothetical protein
VIAWLKRLKFGQEYKDLADQSGDFKARLLSKKGTPTMGGILIVLVLNLTAILWAEMNPLLELNLLAVLVLPAWLGLRQQWAMWATFTGLIGVVPFFEHALGVELPSSVFVGVGVAMGAMARGFLLTSANGRYLKLKRRGLTDGAIREALEGKARSNIPFAVAGGFGSLTVIVGLAHLAQILTGQLGPR